MILLGRILATLVISLGVATGNVSSNNTKNGNALITNGAETKHTKPIQNAPFTQTYTYTKVNSYNSNNIGTGYTEHNEKYYLNNQLNVTSEFGNIYNSVYVDNREHTTYSYESYLTGLYRITPYITSYGSNATFTARYYLNVPTTPSNAVTINYRAAAYLLDPESYSSYIDMTNYNAIVIQSDILDQYYQEHGTVQIPTIATNNNSHVIQPNTQSYIELEIDLGTIENEILLYITCNTQNYTQTTNPNGTMIELSPYQMSINGYHVDINYEVIDLPGLMFDIITMPFSFISQAFDLTVFPGTPYAFNFGNVFLTLIAAFILMWLLKKVF